MPINRPNVGQSGGHSSYSSRLTSATISSSAKCKSDNQSIPSNTNSDYIMKATSNLTRTRSLRLPSRSRDHNYLMSGQLITNTNDSKKTSSLSRHSSFRTSSDSSSSQQSTFETSFNSNQTNNNVTTRSRKPVTNSMTIKDALIPKFVRNSFGKLSKNLAANHALDDSYVDKCRNRDSREDFRDIRRQGPTISNSFNESYLKVNDMRAFVDCPSSPMSNSSRDSGIIGYNGNNVAQNYLSHLRKLTEEHERLQIEYSRVRQQLIEITATVPNKTVSTNSEEKPENIENELEKERSLAKNYKSEVIRLQEELKRLQRKYWDNIIGGKMLNNSNNNNSSTNGSDADLNSSNLQNVSLENEEQRNSSFIEKIQSFQTKIKELENENKEAKESIEFLTSERSILAESLKEAEESLLKERLVWIKEKEAYEEVRTWSKKIYEKLKEKNEKVKELESSIEEKDAKIKDLIQNESVKQNTAETFSQILNSIRQSILSVLTSYQNETAITLSKVWPQFDISTTNNLDKVQFDHNLIKDIFVNAFSENEQLKREIGQIAKQDIDSKQSLLNMECLLKENNSLLDHLKAENESNQKKLVNLSNELDLLTEKYRCSESVNKELKNMIEESGEDSVSSQNANSLRLEIVSLKESLAMKEEMLEKLSSKYARNRKVWEENDRKATQEIKKLDDIVDHVIESLKSLPENLKHSEPIQEILDLLTDETVNE